MATISELEGAVLGTIWLEGPCTPYTVRQVFLRSPNPSWSGSAGAIYPLIARLESRKLLRSERRLTGRRPSKALALTPNGLRTLRTWLKPPFSSRVTGVPPDALRTRLSFLGALAPSERTAFVREAKRGLAVQTGIVTQDCREQRQARQLFAYLTARGALGALRARAAWLNEISKALRSSTMKA
jgi:DNA-binding PadR family transcriptional regulator